jgi:hypothetical protein
MLIFTDTSLTSMQFLGTTEVFGLQELSHNISIAGPNAVVGINNVVYWMGRDKFFTYSGRVDALPCTLRQYIFSDINYNQSQLFFAGTNNQFNEIVWFYCSGSSNEIDRYVIYNYSESIWYYGQLNRTAWLDTGDFNNPIAVADGWFYDQENGVDDGQPNGNVFKHYNLTQAEGVGFNDRIPVFDLGDTRRALDIALLYEAADAEPCPAREAICRCGVAVPARQRRGPAGGDV